MEYTLTRYYVTPIPPICCSVSEKRDKCVTDEVTRLLLLLHIVRMRGRLLHR